MLCILAYYLNVVGMPLLYRYVKSVLSESLQSGLAPMVTVRASFKFWKHRGFLLIVYLSFLGLAQSPFTEHSLGKYFPDLRPLRNNCVLPQPAGSIDGD